MEMLTNASCVWKSTNLPGDLGPFVKLWGLHFSFPVGTCTTALVQLAADHWRTFGDEHKITTYRHQRWLKSTFTVPVERSRVLIEPCRESTVLFIRSSIQILPYFCILLQSQSLWHLLSRFRPPFPFQCESLSKNIVGLLAQKHLPHQWVRCVVYNQGSNCSQALNTSQVTPSHH